jgi:NAD(P)H dehydrogenase (quinone)
MKVAITTASGRLGRAIAQQLSRKIGSENVIGIARTPAKVSNLGMVVRKGDYDNPEDFVKAFQGVDVAIVVSSMAPPEVRIGQHRNVIEGAKTAGVRKIIYTSIFGNEGKCAFDVIIGSNRQTEADIRQSGLQWIIGRNGLYIDADLEAIGEYRTAGGIVNCAAGGRCAYTSREELAAAYACMVTDDGLNGRTYTLAGEPITQQQLTDEINSLYDLELTFTSIAVEDYLQDRVRAHGAFLGPIIAGIYQGISEGAFDIASDFSAVCGREHISLRDMIQAFKDR